MTTIMNRNKSMTSPPKFDTAQLNSPAYYQYFTMVFDREAKKAGMPTAMRTWVGITPRGSIGVRFFEADNVTQYKGGAKCHPNDPFNLEVGLKLAIERAAEKYHATFTPSDGDKYYYVDQHGHAQIAIYMNSLADEMNITMGNCYRTIEQAFGHASQIEKRIEKAIEILRQCRKGDTQ